MKVSIVRFLGGPRVAWVAAALAVLLASPSIFLELHTEDRVHAKIAATGALTLFGAPADTMHTYRLTDAGLLPWITTEDFQLAFFRPVAALTHVADAIVAKENSVVAHAHSVLWLGALSLAAGLFFRRIAATPVVAGLATLFYAIDDGHGPAVGWVANRNVLIGTTLALLALVAHDRWRRDAWKPGAALAPVLFFFALGANELAVGAIGYVAAHAVVYEKRSRLLSLAPFLLVALGWAIAYRAMGFGAVGSGAYVDPIDDPIGFIAQAAWRLPMLFFGALAVPSTDFLMTFESWRAPSAAAWSVQIGLAGVALARPLRVSGEVRFSALGALLATLPACAASPADRLLFLPGIGVMALVAHVVGKLLVGDDGARGLTKVATAALGVVFVVAHGPAAAALLPWRAHGLELHDDWLRAADASAFEGAARAEQLIVVNAPDFYSGAVLASVRIAEGRPVPPLFRVLYGGEHESTLTRLAPDTLRVTPTRGFLEPRSNRVYRSERRPMLAGQGLSLTHVLIMIDEVDASGMPLSATFRFSTPLESPTIAWTAWTGERYERFLPPAVGESVRVPGVEIEY